jgi:hypothetical protein
MSETCRRRTSFDYVRRVYGVPAKRGLRVTVDGKPGVITRAKGQYIMVRFDGRKFPLPCHPTWRVDYAPQAAEGVVRAWEGVSFVSALLATIEDDA